METDRSAVAQVVAGPAGWGELRRAQRRPEEALITPRIHRLRQLRYSGGPQRSATEAQQLSQQIFG
eukprot:7894694-Alexandrium_andersonii.AAC.1